MKVDTEIDIVWCPGCGNFGILKAFKDVFAEMREEDLRKVVLATGVGCHGKIANYLSLSSFHAIHGRVPPLMAGVKLANGELEVVGFAGDGDAYNEGLVHLVHSAKKNVDTSLFVHNNSVYGLTTGQATATSFKGFRGKSTPGGTTEEPLNPVALMLASGATFVARVFAGDVRHFKEIIRRALEHRGFSFVDVLQPCVTFNNTWKYYKDRVYRIEEPESKQEALKLALSGDGIPIGIFHREEREVYEEERSGGKRGVKDILDAQL